VRLAEAEHGRSAAAQTMRTIRVIITQHLASQLAFKPVERGEDETRQFSVLSKQETGDRHHLAAGSGAHASNYQ